MNYSIIIHLLFCHKIITCHKNNFDGTLTCNREDCASFIQASRMQCYTLSQHTVF